MKKTVIGMAMMAMALIGFNGMAQNTAQSGKAQVENNACCKKGGNGKKDGKMQGREKKNPYEGLTLTDAQKSKLAELDAKQQAKRQAAMEARKGQKEGQQKAHADARRAEKMEYLQEVKAIVGPEQYVVFLENMYVNGGQQGGGKAIKQGDRGGKKGMAHAQKGGKQGQRGQKSLKS